MNGETLGFDLLANNSKKTSDVMSVISGASSAIAPKDPRQRRSRSRSTATSSGSSGSDDSSTVTVTTDDSDGSSVITDSSSEVSGRRHEDIMNAKREILYQFDRMERKGIKLPKKFTMANSLEEMKLELERIKLDREVESSIKFQRQMLMTCVSGIEWVNNKFDPFDVKLDGWSEVVSENLGEYDDIFEELYHKYKGRGKLPPELRLLFALGGSAVMFHFSNSMMKYGLEAAMKNNPELMKQFAQATVNSMNGHPTPKAGGGMGGMFGGLGSMLGGLFGGGGGGGLGNLMSAMGGGGGSTGAPPPMPRAPMKGPSNVDDILNELNQMRATPIPPTSSAPPPPQDIPIDRVEVVSTISESEISEDASLSGVFTASKPRKSNAATTRRTLVI